MVTGQTLPRDRHRLTSGMDWTQPVDIYCERTGAAFWAEPFNAVSNTAFLIAAICAYATWRRADANDRTVLGLIVLVAIIGVGSFLFHTFANRWSMLADVLPITVFIYAMFALVFHRFVGLGRWGTALSLAVFLIASFVLEGLSRPLLGGSAGYAPALVAMAGVGAYLNARHHGFGRTLLAAAAVFAVSLTFRTLDIPVCDALPTGTHSIWHILNAVVLGILLIGTIRIR